MKTSNSKRLKNSKLILALATGMALGIVSHAQNWLAKYILTSKATNGQTYTDTVYFGTTNSPTASSDYGLEDLLDPPSAPVGVDASGETTDFKDVQKNIYGTNDLALYRSYIEHNNNTSTNLEIEIYDLPQGKWILRRYTDDFYTVKIEPDLSITNNGVYDLGTNTHSHEIFEVPYLIDPTRQANPSFPTNQDITVRASYYSDMPSTHGMFLYSKSDLVDTNEDWSLEGEMQEEEDIYSMTATNQSQKAKFFQTRIQER